MAEHKVVNVTQLDADLTSIANAIRNRAGTSAKIEFPIGFVNTIRSIPVNVEVGEEIEVESLSEVHYWTKTGMVGGTINETYKSGDIMLGASSDTVQYADEVVLEGNNLVLVNPRDYTLATDDDAAEEVLVGKYVYTTQSKFYRIPSDARIIYNAPTQYTPGFMKVSKAYELSVTAGTEEQTTIVVSNDITAYPENGEQGGFTYVYQGSVNESDIPEVTQATPTITVSTSGLITASATQEAGRVEAGTKSATKQLSTQSAQTITPGTSNKTISSGRYLTGTQTIQGDANLKAENIKKGVSIFGVAGSHECESGGSGAGLVVKSGSTTEQTFDTGLSSISYLVLFKKSNGATGLVEGFFSTDACTYVYCLSYSTAIKNFAIGADVSKYSFDGGTFNLSAIGVQGFSTDTTYYWYAFGTE